MGGEQEARRVQPVGTTSPWRGGKQTLIKAAGQGCGFNVDSELREVEVQQRTP